mgnify:CR=1 FL=1
MAIRPVFVPNENKPPFVEVVQVEFTWHAGFARSQAQKSIQSLHLAAKAKGIFPVLEISSKAFSPLGVRLSAFNLMFKTANGRVMSVESAFQGSKVFELGGPYTDLYPMPGRQAKKDIRLQKSGTLIGFNFLGEDFPTQPLTAFYDWLYLNALYQNEPLARQLLDYKGFTDIAFNPQKSLNCQARAAALYVALRRRGEIEKVIQSKDYYLELVKEERSPSKKKRKPEDNSPRLF